MKARVSVHVLPWILLFGLVAGFLGYRAVDAQTSTFKLDCSSFSMSGSISTGGFSLSDDVLTEDDLDNVSIKSGLYSGPTMQCKISEWP